MTAPRSAPSDGYDFVVRDFWPRLLLSPVIGAAIPNLAGFIDNGRYGPAGLIGHYLYLWLVAFTIWEGNRRLHDRFRSRFAWFEQPWMRIGLLLGTITLFTVPMTWGLLWLWGRLSGDPYLTTARLAFAIVLTVTCVVVIAHVYETLFMFRYWERDRLSKERLERARLQAELDALQRDVDPHFLYNSLNSLLQLIETKPQRAMAFVEALAANYRYVVDTRGRALVPLAEELAAVERQKRYWPRSDSPIPCVSTMQWTDPRRRTGRFRRSSSRNFSRMPSNTTLSTATRRSTCGSSVRATIWW